YISHSIVKEIPLRIKRVDKILLLFPSPALELFFPVDSVINVFKTLPIDEKVSVILDGKMTFHRFCIKFCFVHSSLKIIGHAYIKNRPVNICDDINEVVMSPKCRHG